MTGKHHRASWALHLIFLLSGVAGLGYQVTWLRMFAVGIGHELPSMLAVVSAFFGGLALGSWILDPIVARSSRPGSWYAALEVAIGAWALVTAVMLPNMNHRVAVWIGIDPTPIRHWGLAFGVPFLALLPATFAMGGTFPAMERLAARLAGTGRTVAGLYAVNTAGALAGTLAITFLALPAIGTAATLYGLAAINLGCAAAVRLGPGRGELELHDSSFDLEHVPTPRRLRIAVATTGLCGIGYQVVCVRVMGQVLENTVYSFASGLSAYLLGTALGAVLYQRFATSRSFARTFDALCVATALAIAASPFVLGSSSGTYEQLRTALGGGFRGSVGAELALACFVFLIPTMLMGALFSHLVQASRRERDGVGRAMATNMLGASLAPPVFGVLLLPLLGSKIALAIAAFGYLALAAGRVSVIRAGVAGLAIIALTLSSPSLVLIESPPGGRTVVYTDGVLAAVAVVEDSDGARMLKVNNRFTMGGSRAGFAEWRQAHLPLLLHSEPERALFLGVGAGSTALAATIHPDLDVQAVELVPEVVEVLPWLNTAPPPELGLPPVRYRIADARRFIRASDELFDVIVADLYQPARDGSGSLYTREHFAAIAERMAPRGLFCQWLPLYQMDSETVRLIVRTFFDVFEDGGALVGHYNFDSPILGLVAGMSNYEYGAGWFDRRVADGRLRAALGASALADDLDLFGSFLGDREALLAFSGEGPLNTDDHPRVTFRAPLFTYTSNPNAHGRMVELVDALAGTTGSLFRSEEADFARRIDRHLRARDLLFDYLGARFEGGPRASVDSLIESVKTDAEFETAMTLGLVLALDPGFDEMFARQLLDRLEQARPGDERVAQVRAQRFP